MGGLVERRSGIVAVIPVKQIAGSLELHATVVTVNPEMSAIAVHEPLEGGPRCGPDGRRIGNENRLVSPRLHGVLDATGDFVEGLVPTHGLEQARSARSDASQGLVQALGTIDPITQCPPAQAGAHPRNSRGLLAVVGLDPQDLSVTHLETQQATRSAIERARLPNLADPRAIGAL